MAQNISYLITPSIIKLPIDIVHFYEKNNTVIPLLMKNGAFEDLLNLTSDSENIQEFWSEILNIPTSYEYPTRKAFEYLSRSEVTSFGILYFYDHFIVPPDTKPILFINSQRAPLAWDNFMNDTHKLLGCDIFPSHLLNNESQYWDFYTAEQAYFTALQQKLQ
jgi:hypothetical protein